jgi:transaldolase
MDEIGPRLFLDSASVAEWRALLPLGIFHGVTTNPTLLVRAGIDCTLRNLGALTEEAQALGCRELHLQAWGESRVALTSCGRQLAALAPATVVVKLAATVPGFEAACALHAEGVRITITAVYAPAQALAAAALGASYAAPYFGRLGDAGHDAAGVVLGMRSILRHAGDGTRLLLASLRRAEDVAMLAARGCDTFTVGAAVAKALVHSDESEAAAEAFDAHARVGAAGPPGK